MEFAGTVMLRYDRWRWALGPTRRRLEMMESSLAMVLVDDA
jgi:hypothetical protein